MDNTVSTEPSFLEFSNDNLHVKAHFKPMCKVELAVETTAPLVKQAHQQAAKLVGKEVVIPGFRKGKAPINLVEKNYPKPIADELQKALSQIAFSECLKLTNIPILNNEFKINYHVKDYSVNTGAHLTLFFETEPTLPKIDPAEIRLKSVKRPAVDEDKVSETIRQAALFFAEWSPVKDRPVTENDFVLLDVDVIQDDGTFSSLFSKVRFEVTSRAMAKWMKDLVLGHNIGEVLEGISTPDAEDPAEDVQSLEPKKVKVTIHMIETAKTPEITDEWAQKLGSSSVSDLHMNVEKLLNSKADAHVKEKLREQISEILLNNYKFDVPQSLIEREVKFRMQQLLQDSEYLKHWNTMNMDAKKEMFTNLSEQSAKAVRMFYLCRSILDHAKISLKPASQSQQPAGLLDLFVGSGSQNHLSGNPQTREAEELSQRLFETAEDYLISHAVIE